MWTTGLLHIFLGLFCAVGSRSVVLYCYSVLRIHHLRGRPEMSALFPYANFVAGVLILVVGFCFHWLGQLVSVLNWNLATRIGL
jgi:hypothetical protein